MNQLGKQTTATELLELERRLSAVEADFTRMRNDVVKYTDHVIKVMRSVTIIAIEMQKHGMSTQEAADVLRDSPRPKH